MLDDTFDENHYIISLKKGNDTVKVFSIICVTSW